MRGALKKDLETLAKAMKPAEFGSGCLLSRSMIDRVVPGVEMGPLLHGSDYFVPVERWVYGDETYSTSYHPDTGIPFESAPCTMYRPTREFIKIAWSVHVRRDALDRSYTPHWCTEGLLEHVHVSGRILEPCAGKGGIASPLARHGLDVMWQDIDKDGNALVIQDFMAPDHQATGYDWIISNVPYQTEDYTAADFVRKALTLAPKVAMLLRISWLEPCADRIDILEGNPPSLIIYLPRPSFNGPGRSNGTDTCTSVWAVWGVPPGNVWIGRNQVARLSGQQSLDLGGNQ